MTQIVTLGYEVILKIIKVLISKIDVESELQIKVIN